MATLTRELVTQRSGHVGVSHTASRAANATTEVAWASTTTLPYAVVTNRSVSANQKTKEAIEERLAANPTWTPAPAV